MFEGLKIYDITSLNKKYANYSIVLGHSFYQKGKILQEKNQNICNVHYLTSVSYGQTKTIKYEFIKKYKNEYQQSFNILEDVHSKENMCAYLNARMNDDAKEIFSCLVDTQASYFENDVFHIGNSEIYVDVGAYDGDSIKSFLQANGGSYRNIIALEPNEGVFSRLAKYVQEENLLNVELLCKGAWSNTGFLVLQGIEQEGMLLNFKETNGKRVEVESLDCICREYERITFIKINILSGIEECLFGARKILRDFCPRLAITVGFDEWALLKIPVLIKKLQPKYKLYLRYNGGKMPARLTLYAAI